MSVGEGVGGAKEEMSRCPARARASTCTDGKCVWGVRVCVPPPLGGRYLYTGLPLRTSGLGCGVRLSSRRSRQSAAELHAEREIEGWK